ncbi:MAG: ATPase, partial [Arenibacter sp.]|nr:ATPase [Arenibacter sp.]
ETLFIAATNHLEVIDKAILRRFQLRLKFTLPSKSELDSYYDKLLNNYPAPFRKIARKYDISYAEAQDIIHREVKKLIIEREESEEQK